MNETSTIVNLPDGLIMFLDPDIEKIHSKPWSEMFGNGTGTL